MVSDADTQSDTLEQIQYFKDSLDNGKRWYIALLETISKWSLPEETYQGHNYQYLIDGEAFDWILLAERLYREVSDHIPENEMLDLLFGQMPTDLQSDEFKRLLGDEKYKGYLNYFYGVTVEQGLQLSVELAFEKGRQANVGPRDYADNVFKHIYGSTEMELLDNFRKDKGYLLDGVMSLRELSEFTYWLFKYRVKNGDGARIASDTKQALNQLEKMQNSSVSHRAV